MAKLEEQTSELDKIVASVRELDAAAMPGPWLECKHDRGGCKCGLIWSIPADAPVVHAEAFDDNLYEEGPTHEARNANARLVAGFRTLAVQLADAVEALQRKLEQKSAVDISIIRATRKSAAKVAAMLELGDNRLLASDGPVGGQLPQLSPDEWGKVYDACKAIAALAPASGQVGD